jgi:hypothetical protein
VELRVAHLTHRHVETGKPDYDQLDSWLWGGNAAWHFGSDARAQWYVLGGLGLIKASASKRCSTCEWNVDSGGNRIYRDTGESEHGTDPVYIVGTGFKTAVAPHVSLRGEFLAAQAFRATYQARFLDGTVNQSTGPWGWARVTIGAALQF